MSYVYPAPAPTRSRRTLRGLGCNCGRRRMSGMGAIALPVRAAGSGTVATPIAISGGTITPAASSYPTASGAAAVRSASPSYATPIRVASVLENEGLLSTTGSSTSSTAGVTGGINPAGGPPSTILDYDTQGNPVYSVPPPGQQIVGYDADGNPLYGSSSAGVVTGLDAAGNPIYSVPPAGEVIVGYDQYGDPIYSNADSALPSSGYAASAPAAVTVQTSASDYQSILDWLSEQTLITGIPNWGIVAAGVVGVYLLKNHMDKRR